jgi:hypothetical protein
MLVHKPEELPKFPAVPRPSDTAQTNTVDPEPPCHVACVERVLLPDDGSGRRKFQWLVVDDIAITEYTVDSAAAAVIDLTGVKGYVPLTGHDMNVLQDYSDEPHGDYYTGDWQRVIATFASPELYAALCKHAEEVGL